MAKKKPDQKTKTAPAPKEAPRKAQPAPVRHPLKAAALLYSAPPYILRGPIYMMFVTLISMLVYSIVATSDVLVSAPARLQRQSVTVQAVGGGLVEAMEVSENSEVSAGSPMAVIQERIRAASTPEQEAIDRQLRDYDERRAQLNRDYQFRRQQLESQRDELARRLSTGQDTLVNRVAQLEIQLRTAQRRRGNLEEDLGSAEQNAARLRPLCDRRDIPRVRCEQADTRVSELRRARDNTLADIENIRLSIQTTQGQLEQQGDQATLERLNADLAKLAQDFETERAQIEERIADLEERRDEAQVLVPGVRPGRTDEDRDKVYYFSTVDGIVTATHVERGQLINPGNPIVTIVRNAAPLEARVLVQNQDIGQLKVGQDVKLKYYAYPYQEYGIQGGTIADISTRPSAEPGEQSLYVVNVALASETIRGPSGVDRALEIGLQGIAEIKTGQRRFIEILFSPAAKFFRGGEGDDRDGEPASDQTTTQTASAG